MKIIFISLLLIGASTLMTGQSPTDIHTDIEPSHGFSTVAAIASSFNNARRNEETQLNLGNNVIDDLVMPAQLDWDNMSPEAKALYLLNDERTSRMGVNYGSGPVDGYPFEGVGTNLTAESQAYAAYLLNNNLFTHCPTSNNCPIDRINDAVGSSCQEFVPYTENIYVGLYSVAGHHFTNAIEEAIYKFIYDDASSGWGHRRMCLYQDFNDNYGDPDKRGIIGIGISEGGPYLGWASGVTVVMNYFDPVTSCSETLYVDTDDISGEDCPDDVLILNGIIPPGMHSSNHIESAGTVLSTRAVTFQATTTVEINNSFEIDMLGTLSVEITGCN